MQFVWRLNSRTKAFLQHGLREYLGFFSSQMLVPHIPYPPFINVLWWWGYTYMALVVCGPPPLMRLYLSPARWDVPKYTTERDLKSKVVFGIYNWSWLKKQIRVGYKNKNKKNQHLNFNWCTAVCKTTQKMTKAAIN